MWLKKYIILPVFFVLNAAFGSDVYAKPTVNDTIHSELIQFGVASYYADKFEGRKTANGEIFRQNKLTAAHNTLPLGTFIIVTNIRNNKSVKVKINDRLHYRNKRLVDLSKAAAKKIGFLKMGITRVKVEVVK
jgi:rare lipoprotein A